MKRITVLGSLNMDLVTRVAHTPVVGETIRGDGFDSIPGGKGANQAAAIARLGGTVGMIGRIGTDNFGQVLVDALEGDGVETGNISISEEPTGTAIIMVNDDGDNSIVVVPGANFDLTPNLITHDFFDDTDILLAQLETPIDTIKKAFKIAKERNIKTVLNPAPAKELPRALLELTDLIIPNEREFEAITGIFIGDADEGIKILFDKGIGEVILTLGAKGARYQSADGVSFSVPAHDVKAIDTTAAGDSFIGGYLVAQSRGEEVLPSLKYAAAVAAATVTRFGAQSSIPTEEEVTMFLEEVERID